MAYAIGAIFGSGVTATPIIDQGVPKMVIILMGVSGSGKTTVGQTLAHKLHWEFHDADELHSPANIEKMRRGIALTDDDREAWLDAVRALIERCLDGAGAVIACSALKQSYRERLMVDSTGVRLVFLKGSRALIARRLAMRAGHFFDPRLLRSQFETLEEPADAMVVDISASPDAIAEDITARLHG
ncbi:MAG: gluconokinase [Candidatus Binataceae bacterium]